MPSGGSTIDLPIKVPVETNAEEAADSVEALSASITSSLSAIKQMQGAQRLLTGADKESKDAKAKLTAEITKLKGSVSSSVVTLHKQGAAYDELAIKEKKAAAERKKFQDTIKKDQDDRAKASTEALTNALRSSTGPLATVAGLFMQVKGAATSSSAGMNLAKLAVAGTVVAIAAMAGAVAGAGIALAKFIFQSSNAARAANLTREAFYLNEENAKRMGSQIDALSDKVPTSRDRLNELAVGLGKMRIGGQLGVDALNAVAQASSALGDEAGNKLQEFITRGRMVGRLRIDPYEMLEGFGNLQFTDISQALAKDMKIGVADAAKLLRSGAVPIGAGAKAVRAAVEKQFGSLNARKMLDLNVIAEQMHKKFQQLTEGVNLEPLLKPLNELMHLFDSTTVTGQALKGLVQRFGDGVVGAMQKGLPLAKAFFQGLVIGSLKAEIAFYNIELALIKAFGPSAFQSNGDSLTSMMKIGETVATSFAVAVFVVGGAIAGLGYAAFKTEELFGGFVDKIKSTADELKGGDWKGAGLSIVNGLISGLNPGHALVEAAMSGLGGTAIKAFKNAIDSHSPSKKFEKEGFNTTEGVVGGVKKGTPRVAQAVDDMGQAAIAAAPMQFGAGGGSSSRSSSPVSVTVNINVGGGAGGAASAASMLQDPSFIAKITKVFEDICVQSGIAVGT